MIKDFLKRYHNLFAPNFKQLLYNLKLTLQKINSSDAIIGEVPTNIYKLIDAVRFYKEHNYKDFEARDRVINAAVEYVEYLEHLNE